MKKIIKISESQLRHIINRSINENIDISDIKLISHYLSNAILNGGILYDKDCPEIGENMPTLVSSDGNYTAYLVGRTDSEPYKTRYSPGDYYTPPSGGEIEWEPKIFYVKDVFLILKNTNNDIGEEIDDDLFNALKKEILSNISKVPINGQKYEIVINTEDIEDFDTSDIEYDDYRDKEFR